MVWLVQALSGLVRVKDLSVSDQAGREDVGEVDACQLPGNPSRQMLTGRPAMLPRHLLQAAWGRQRLQLIGSTQDRVMVATAPLLPTAGEAHLSSCRTTVSSPQSGSLLCLHSLALPTPAPLLSTGQSTARTPAPRPPQSLLWLQGSAALEVRTHAHFAAPF